MIWRNFFKTIVFAVLVSTFSCEKQKVVTQTTFEQPIVLKDTFDYLALGDSYTIGTGINANDSWPNQLSHKLKAANLPLGKTKIIAQNGWTTTNLINAIDNSDLSELRQKKIVSLLIGVNNQYQNISFDLFETEYEQLLQKAIGIAGDTSKVFVVSIPDYGVTPFGSTNSAQIAIDIDKYNFMVETKCKQLGITFINVTEIGRQLGSGQNALAPDQLHPSAYQYGLWVEEFLPVVVGLMDNG